MSELPTNGFSCTPNEALETETKKFPTYTAVEWMRIAGTRQGVINKLDKKVERLKAQNQKLREQLAAAGGQHE